MQLTTIGQTLRKRMPCGSQSMRAGMCEVLRVRPGVRLSMGPTPKSDTLAFIGTSHSMRHSAFLFASSLQLFVNWFKFGSIGLCHMRALS